MLEQGRGPVEWGVFAVRGFACETLAARRAPTAERRESAALGRAAHREPLGRG